MMIGVYLMKHLRLKTLGCILSFIGFAVHGTQAKDVKLQHQPVFEAVKTTLQKLKQENPFTETSLTKVKAEVVTVARSAGCGLADLLVLNSFASRLVQLAEKAPAVVSAFGKEFFNKILPKHEDAIIEIMQTPEFAPIQDLLTEQLEVLPKLLDDQKAAKPSSSKQSDIEQKMQKLNDILNGCQGQLHKIMGVLLTIGAYAEAIAQSTQKHSYQALFNDVKATIVKVAAEHLDLCDINHIERFLKSEACQKLLTRYDELVKVVINVLKPGYYQNTASSLWDQAKTYAFNLVAAVK